MSAREWEQRLAPRRRVALARAVNAQQDANGSEDELRAAVQEARACGVPILLLADALGVSRSRIRVLARDSKL